ncbi:DUF4836 family protein [Neptunitalea lumnitzerae]|uniref:DUF4836 family protein n=1 Tax=Neptunitalea lumnitzerae TaxID=2965509 RepID=A0ABQ5MES6_9FLAO|nr:DUF4836 family protein [Neptunitalea sp. Y10]GLB47816.1 hypothetical protein Y10_01840 [Neptunitalea sp. Y10]
MQSFFKMGYLKVSAFLLAISFFASCSNVPDTVESLPATTQFVTVLNIPAIAEKGNFDEVKEFKSFKMASSELKTESKELAELFDGFMDDPASSGIKLNSDAFVCLINETASEKYMGLLLALNDGDNFKEFLKKVFKAADQNYDLGVSKEYGFNTVWIADEALVAWDDHKAIFLSGLTYRAKRNLEFTMNELFEGNEGGLVANDSFNEFYSNKEDVSMWYSGDLIAEAMSMNPRAASLPLDKLEGSYLYTYLNFEEGEISVTAKFKPSEELIEELGTDGSQVASFNKDLVKYLPKKSLIAMSGAADMPLFAEAVKGNPSYDMMTGMVEGQLGISLDELYRSFGGSFVITLSDFTVIEVPYYPGSMEMEEKPLPEVNLVLDITNKDLVPMLLKKFPPEMISNNGSYYEIRLDSSYKCYLNYNSDAVLVTTSLDAAKAFGKGGLDANLGDTVVGEQISENPFYMYLDLDFSRYPQEMVESSSVTNNPVAAGYIKTWNEFADGVEVKYQGDFTVQGTFRLKDENNNSLFAIFKLMDTMVQDL